MGFRPAAAVVFVLCATVAGCRDRDPTTASPDAQAQPASADEEVVDRLRALGYVDFAPGGGDGRGDGVVHRDASASYPGYDLIVSAHLCSAVLMDEAGGIQNAWGMEGCFRWANAELTGSGDLVLAGIEGSQVDEDLNEAWFLLKLSWHGRELWRRRYPAHHDVHLRPDGRLIALVAEDRIVPEVSDRVPVRDNALALLSPDGIELDRISLYELFARNRDVVSLEEVHRPRRKRLDLFHANSVEELPGDPADGPVPGRVLVSIRHQDTVAIVEWRSRRIEWAWGRGVIAGPHDATMLASGNLLVFDNGLGRGWSRVVELNPRSREIVWQYAAPRREEFYTLSRGSNQRLPNGNTLIAESDRGHAFEVTPAGEIVWEFWNPLRNPAGERATIVRVKRYERQLVDGIVQRLGPGRKAAPPPPGRGPATRG